MAELLAGRSERWNRFPGKADRMTDEEILTEIHNLVDEEHRLRERPTDAELSQEEQQARGQRLDVALDRCWDLLRQRRARNSAGEDPGLAHARGASEVEGYIQ